MVVGKKTSKNKKCKLNQSTNQQQQTASSADILKDEVSLTNSVPLQLSESAIELGYNSEDEYDRAGTCNISAKEIEEIEKRFEKKMRKKGFIIKKMAEDGACLFRAVADQIYGDQEMHQALRKLCMDYMAKNSDYFSHYVTEDFDEYIKRKRLNSCHGNHVEIQALSEMFNRPIEVYHYNCEPINIFQGCSQAEIAPIRLSYHQNVHYNSVVDPYKATIGVGLGFPSYKPGSAEKSLLEKAMRISEEQELEQVMLEDKMKMTDWEATNEAIEEQIARESYVEWLKENERKLSKNKKVKFTATATATTTSVNSNVTNNSPSNKYDEKQKSPKLSPKLSPKAGSSGINNNSYNNFGLIETGTFVNQFAPQMFGFNDWDNEDGDILRQVLAQSQQEYLDSLKRKAKEMNSENKKNDKPTSSNLIKSDNINFSYDNNVNKEITPNKKLKTDKKETMNKIEKLDENLIEKSIENSSEDEKLNKKKTEILKNKVIDLNKVNSENLVINENEFKLIENLTKDQKIENLPLKETEKNSENSNDNI